MGIDVRYPERHADFLARCHAAGPDPADAAAAALRRRTTTTACTRTCTASTCFRSRSRSCCPSPGEDFTGGEFVLTEQRPRMQSRAEVVPLAPGRRRDLRRPPPPGAGHARRLPRQPPPRRQPRALRAAPHAGRHLPRRAVSGARPASDSSHLRGRARGHCASPLRAANSRRSIYIVCHVPAPGEVRVAGRPARSRPPGSQPMTTGSTATRARGRAGRAVRQPGRRPSASAPISSRWTSSSWTATASRCRA